VCGELLILGKSVIRHTQLEQMMVSAIDERNPDGCIAERPRRRQTAETSSNDHNMWEAY
jgi:hypothetical protein